MSIENNADVYVSLALQRTVGRGPNVSIISELEVRDVLSGQCIVAIQFTPDQLVDLLAGGYRRREAWVCPPSLRERIGRKTVTDKIEVPSSIIGRYENGYVLGTADAPEAVMTPSRTAAQEWVHRKMLEGGWEDFELRHQNDGWWCILRKWVPVEEAADAATAGA